MFRLLVAPLDAYAMDLYLAVRVAKRLTSIQPQTVLNVWQGMSYSNLESLERLSVAKNDSVHLLYLE